MYKNAPDTQYVPSKSIAIKPDVVSDVIPDEISRTLLPSYLGFVDPRETYIKFNLQMKPQTGQAVGMIRPQKEAGAHAIFRNVLLRDGANSTTLESLEDYNARVAMKNPFTAQDSISHKRELFDGVMENPNLGTATGNLYYKPSGALPAAAFAGIGVRADSQSGGRAANTTTPQLQFRLDTGLMKGSQVIPVAALQGLRVQLDMENAARACEFAAGDAGQLLADGSVSAVGLGGGTCVLSAVVEKQDTAVGANAVRNDARAAGTDYGQSFFSVQVKLAATASNLNNPFDIGDKLFARAAIGRVINGTAVSVANQADTEVELGVICGFYSSTDVAGELGIYYVPQRATGVSLGQYVSTEPNFNGQNITFVENDPVFYKPENRALPQTGVLTSTDNGNVAVGAGTANFVAPSYVVSDLEFLCLSVQPPEAYVNGLMSASTSERGVSMDIMTSSTQRFNQSTAAGLTSNLIPCSQKRVKSVFVQPLVIADFRDFNKRSLSGVPDNARQYQFVYGTELIPVKNVPLGRYSQVVDTFGTANQNVSEQNKAEAIHLSQLEGALVNSGNMPRSLHRVAKNFAIARAFSKYNQVADLSEQSLSCRIDYENTATGLKIFNNYIDHLRRISITNNGVEASDL